MNFIPTQDQKTAHQAKCFLVTCMDFRLIDDSVYFMNGLGFNNNYDEFVLAGSSLGFTQAKFPHWGQTLLDHMSIGQTLHHFKQIIFIDHMDCGAYKKFHPEMKTQADEIELHKQHMKMAREKLRERFPHFRFRGFLMNLDGKCKEIHTDVNECRHATAESQEDFFSQLEFTK